MVTVFQVLIKQQLLLLDMQKTPQFQGDTVYASGESTSRNGLQYLSLLMYCCKLSTLCAELLLKVHY